MSEAHVLTKRLGMSSDFLRLSVRPAPDVARLVAGLQDYGRVVSAGH